MPRPARWLHRGKQAPAFAHLGFKLAEFAEVLLGGLDSSTRAELFAQELLEAILADSHSVQLGGAVKLALLVLAHGDSFLRVADADTQKQRGQKISGRKRCSTHDRPQSMSSINSMIAHACVRARSCVNATIQAHDSVFKPHGRKARQGKARQGKAGRRARIQAGIQAGTHQLLGREHVVVLGLRLRDVALGVRGQALRGH